jgi:hypothetical protein
VNPDTTIGDLTLIAGDDDFELGPDAQVLEDEITAARKAAVDTYGSKINKEFAIKKQKRPKSKVLSGKNSGITLTIKNKKGGGDVHVTFYKYKGKKKRLSAYIRSGKTLTVHLPAGTYRMVQGTGKTWYGDKYSFGPDGSYQQSGKKMTLSRGSRYTLTLYVVKGGNMPINGINYPY